MVGCLTLGSALPHLINAMGGLRWTVVIISTSILTLVGGILIVTLAKDGPFGFPPSIFQPKNLYKIFFDRGVVLATLGYIGHMWELYA
jgi:hypothetical protein